MPKVRRTRSTKKDTILASDYVLQAHLNLTAALQHLPNGHELETHLKSAHSLTAKAAARLDPKKKLGYKPGYKP